MKKSELRTLILAYGNACEAEERAVDREEDITEAIRDQTRTLKLIDTELTRLYSQNAPLEAPPVRYVPIGTSDMGYIIYDKQVQERARNKHGEPTAIFSTMGSAVAEAEVLNKNSVIGIEELRRDIMATMTGTKHYSATIVAESVLSSYVRRMLNEREK